MEKPEIVKGSVVRFKSFRDGQYNDGYYRVSARFNKTVNLAGIFSSFIHFRKVPIEDVTEAREEWYAKWQQSETYQCM